MGELGIWRRSADSHVASLFTARGIAVPIENLVAARLLAAPSKTPASKRRDFYSPLRTRHSR
jgi:hypothetical protein